MKTHWLKLTVLALTLLGCAKDNNPSQNNIVIVKEELSGNIQKGPFVNGSSLTIFELDENHIQTGKTFNTQISDNTGNFYLTGITLNNPYAKLKADGFYFNEVLNANSLASITLYAISDVSDKTRININLLTTLEIARVEYLLNSGLLFEEAKKQAQEEILNIFSISKDDIPDSELLDISQGGDNNGILLAISLILQGYRTEADLSQLLGDISTDIRPDGILNDQLTGSSLINDIKLIDLPAVRTNLENKYQSLGISSIIPDFEKYVKLFIDSTRYIFTKVIGYPYIVNDRENLLCDSNFNVGGGIYSIAAHLPIGTSLKVVIKPTSGYNWHEGNIGFFVMENIGWTFSNYHPDSVILIANGNNETIDLPCMFGPPTSSDFILYENNSNIPTRIKVIEN